MVDIDNPVMTAEGFIIFLGVTLMVGTVILGFLGAYLLDGKKEAGIAAISIAIMTMIGSVAVLAYYSVEWGNISEQINEYVEEEGGLDHQPDLRAKNIIDGIKKSSEGFYEETIKFEIDGESYMTTLVFSMEKQGKLEIVARAGSTGSVQPWNTSTALGGDLVSNGGVSGVATPSGSMDKRVSAYLQANGELDKAPRVNVAAEIEELAENKIQSFRKVVDLTLDGQVYPTTLVFSLDGTGALDIEIAAGGSTVPLSPAAIVEAQTADSGKIIVIDE